MSKFAILSQIVLDNKPATISSAAANATDTPTELQLSTSDIWEVSGLRLRLLSKLILSASDTVTVTVDVNRIAKDGTVTALDTLTLAITAGTEVTGEMFIDVSSMVFTDTLKLTTTTTVLGTATYEVDSLLEFSAPIQVN